MHRMIQRSWLGASALAGCAELGGAVETTDVAGDAARAATGAGLDPVLFEQLDAFVWPQPRVPSDAGAAPPAAPDTGFSCDGGTPHGCFAAAPDNPEGCPPQIHEQSSGYPPLEEWTGCEAPWYVPCVYRRPDGSDASCVCDLGFHWICAY